MALLMIHEAVEIKNSPTSDSYMNSDCLSHTTKKFLCQLQGEPQKRARFP